MQNIIQQFGEKKRPAQRPPRPGGWAKGAAAFGGEKRRSVDPTHTISELASFRYSFYVVYLPIFSAINCLRQMVYSVFLQMYRR